MALETEGLLDAVAEMMNSVRIHCNDCERDYYGSVKFDQASNRPHVRGVCPRCGSRNVELSSQD